METKISSWMFREPGEFWALFVSVILITIISLFLSLFNIYLVLLLFVAAIIFVRFQQSQFLGNAIRVYQEQFPEIYEVFEQHAKLLGIPKAALYIKQDPQLNAFTLGINFCTVVVTSSLVEQLSPEELSFTIGHELGHYKAGHTKLSTLLIPLGSNIFSTFIFGFWQRKTELSADRCGLIITKNVDSAVTTLLKLALGAHLFKNLNLKGYKVQMLKADTLMVKMSSSLSDHPLITKRVENLLLFWESNFKAKNED